MMTNRTPKPDQKDAATDGKIDSTLTAPVYEVEFSKGNSLIIAASDLSPVPFENRSFIFIFIPIFVADRPRCTRSPPLAWRGCESASWWRGGDGGGPCCVPLCAWYVRLLRRRLPNVGVSVLPPSGRGACSVTTP